MRLSRYEVIFNFIQVISRMLRLCECASIIAWLISRLHTQKMYIFNRIVVHLPMPKSFSREDISYPSHPVKKYTGFMRVTYVYVHFPTITAAF
jgi:hypothetical protein